MIPPIKRQNAPLVGRGQSSAHGYACTKNRQQEAAGRNWLRLSAPQREERRTPQPAESSRERQGGRRACCWGHSVIIFLLSTLLPSLLPGLTQATCRLSRRPCVQHTASLQAGCDEDTVPSLSWRHTHSVNEIVTTPVSVTHGTRLGTTPVCSDRTHYVSVSCRRTVLWARPSVTTDSPRR